MRAYVWLTLLVAVVGVPLVDSAGTGATPCTPPPAGLVSWWPGDGNAQDISDGNHGTLEGGTSFGDGVVGQALSLDGFDDLVTIGNPANLHLGASDFTVDAWVNFDSLVAPPGSPSTSCSEVGCDMSIVSKMAGTATNDDGWRLLKQLDNRLWFCLGSPGNGCSPWAPTTVRSSTIPTPGVWYHVAGVKSSDAISIYVQGSVEESKPLPSFTDSDSAAVLVGYGIVESLMYGRIDEVEVFNRALTSAEIQAIYNAGAAGKCKSPSPVGGIAKVPAIAESGGSPATYHIALAGVAAAALLALTAGAWYAMRRWLR